MSAHSRRKWLQITGMLTDVSRLQEHGSSLGLSIAALMSELGRTQKEREEGERYRREPLQRLFCHPCSLEKPRMMSSESVAGHRDL